MSSVLPQPMTARRLLRLAVVADLTAALDGVTVQSPGNWPTQPEQMPALLVKTTSARKQSKGRNVPQFDATVMVQIEGRLKADTPEAAQDAIEALEYQVEEIVLDGHWTQQVVQQFASVSSDIEVNSEGKTHLAGFRMVVECETFEDFDETAVPPESTTWPLAQPVIGPLQGVDLHADMVDQYDPTGTYPTSEFQSEVLPAPRTSGPDGRDEAALQIDLPQS